MKKGKDLAIITFIYLVAYAAGFAACAGIGSVMARWFVFDIAATVVTFILSAVLFNVVSIPMMEKRQLARRPDYADYSRVASRLLLLPNKTRMKAAV